MKALAIILLILLSAAGAAAGYLWYCLEKPYGVIPAEGVFVEIPHGASKRAAARILQKNGVLRSAVAFEIYARRHPRRNLEAGEYFFDHALTGKEVFWKLANGEVYQQPFTVREGETIFDIARDLEAAKLMKASEFLPAAKNAELISDIAPGAKTLEGFLFPATYNLAKNTTPADLTAMMVRKFREAWEQVAPGGPTEEDRKISNYLLYMVTMASLVERETPRPEERPQVAGVFANRLEKGIPLQCDPTVIYALDEAGKYKGTLTLKDLRYDSPYNTYANRGLPPGPIGNPSLESLRAALHPAQTDYLYFVANTRGGHFFAATLAEHNRNVAKYHRLLNGDPEELPVVQATHPRVTSTARKGKR